MRQLPEPSAPAVPPRPSWVERRGPTTLAVPGTRRSGRGGRLVVLGCVLLLGLAVLVALDALARRTVERRVAEQLGPSLGGEANVALAGWPFALAVLGGTLPSAAVDVALVQRGASGRVVLSDVAVDIGARDLFSDRPLSLRSPTGTVELTFAPGRGPWGLTRADGRVDDVRVRAQEDRTRVSLTSLTLAGDRRSAGADRPLDAPVTVRLDEVSVLAAGGPGAPGPATVVAQSVQVRARDEDSGQLPLGVTSVVLTLESAVLRTDAADLRARAATAVATGVPLEGGDVRLRRLEADLPQLAATPRDDGTLLLMTRAGSFTAELDEDSANLLSDLPGTVTFATGGARLNLGPVGVDLDIGVQDGSVAFTPRLPSLLETVLGDLGTVSVDPQLPQGALLTSVELRTGVLVLEGSGTELVLPASG